MWHGDQDEDTQEQAIYRFVKYIVTTDKVKSQNFWWKAHILTDLSAQLII